MAGVGDGIGHGTGRSGVNWRGGGLGGALREHDRIGGVEQGLLPGLLLFDPRLHNEPCDQGREAKGDDGDASFIHEILRLNQTRLGIFR